MKIPRGDLIGNPVIRTISEVITPAGGVVRDAKSGLTVQFLPDAVTKPVTVTIDITANQLPSVSQEGYAMSRHGCVVTFDATKLSRVPRIRIGMRASDFEEQTVLCVADTGDAEWPIPTPPSEDGKRRIGELPLRFFLRGPEPALPTERKFSLRIYTATRLALQASPFESYVAVFDPNSNSWSRTIPSLAGKRVAFLVHGVVSSLDDLTALAAMLSRYMAPGGLGMYYDYVVGYNYTSNTTIPTIGSSLIQKGTPLIAGAKGVDLFAHSMGNLVSRWAMEVGRSGQLFRKVDHYVSLAGPHAGVPFGDHTILEEFLKLFDPDVVPCLLDLMTMGYGGTASAFLQSINTTNPNPQGTRYYTLAGTDWSNYWVDDVPVGYAIYGFYFYAGAPDPGSQDGLVAVYSAQSGYLRYKDWEWGIPEWATQSWTHATIHTAQSAFDAIKRYIDSWAATALGGDTIADESSVKKGIGNLITPKRAEK